MPPASLLNKSQPFVIFGEIASPISETEWRHYEQGALAVGSDGRIAWCGDAQDLPQAYAQWDQRRNSQHQIILPGFVDTHLHYPQTNMIGSWGADLLDWLQRYTFPEESRFGDSAYATQVAKLFVRQLRTRGTTTACVFSTVHMEAYEALTQACQSLGLHVVTGITGMNRNCPEALQLSLAEYQARNEAAYQLSQTLPRCDYAVTPRFAITSTGDHLAYAGEFLSQHPEVLMQTHLNENRDEILFTAQLFPEAQDYLDVYDRFGLVTARSLFAHGIHGHERELARMAEQGAAVIHCPTSNTFLGSGLLDAERYSQAGVMLGMGSDTGGGTSFSPFATMAEAYKIGKLNGHALRPERLWYNHTLGNAKILNLYDQVGSLEAGKWADFLVIEPQQHALLQARWDQTPDFADRLFGCMFVLPETPAAMTACYFGGKPL